MIVFYDLETTGLPKAGDDPLKQPGIVQIGAVLVDPTKWRDVMHANGDVMARGTDGIVAEFNEKINPELMPDRFEPGAVRVHGITWNDAQQYPSFFTVGEKFAQFCVGATIRSGYNIVDFDDRILLWQLRRYAMECHYPWAPTVVDVALLAKASGRYIGKRGPKFPKLIELFQDVTGRKLEGAHDALADIKATVTVAKTLFSDGFGA